MYSFSACNKASLVLCLGVILIISSVRNTKSEMRLEENGDKDKFMALQIFGDSIVDTGNNNGLKTIIKSDFPPYGRDFKDGKATGRFCNGKIISDFIAEAFGIKELLPSFHDANLQSKDLQTGLSFASAGSGYDPLTSKLLQVYTQQEQIQFFEEYIVKLKKDVGEEGAKTIVSKSLYVVSSGNNDILITYFASQIRRLHFDFPSYTDFLLKYATRFFKDLYNLGARRIAVFNIAPLGCVPFARTIGGGLGRECVDKISKAAEYFNAKLTAEIASLNKQLAGCRIIIVDVHTPVLQLFQHPHNYGYEVIEKGCCSTGTLETGILCNKLLPTCKNTSAYMFWDSIHPTESAYRTLAPAVVNQIVF